MYAGLPHPFFDEGEFVWKLWTTSNRPIHGYRFYREPIIPAAAVRTRIVDVLSKKESYRAYRGAKACGGYHADFAVKLESAGRSSWLLVCLGCGEVLLYSEGGELICELEREAERQLEEAWKDHQGIPFVSFSSRLPIKRDTVLNWGFYFSDAWDSSSVEWGHEGVSFQALARIQKLTVRRPPGNPSAPRMSFELREEAHETSELAEQRLKQLYEAAGRVRRRKQDATQASPAPLRPPRERFVCGKHLYWITGDKGTSRKDVRRVRDLVRRYCEEIDPHEVRIYR
jgi:hypothetical protein